MPGLGLLMEREGEPGGEVFHCSILLVSLSRE